MSLQLLPIDLKIRLLELCPQLRYVLSELRDLLKKFKKLEELDYPTEQNNFREKVILTYNGMSLHFTAKLWDCILTLNEYTWSSDSIVFHPILPYLAIGNRNNAEIMLKINEDKTIEEIGTFIGHSCTIICAEFHPYLPIMATGSSDKTAKLWYVNADNTIICYATLTGHEFNVYRVIFHPILPILATLCPGSRLKLWRIDTINPVCFATLDREVDTFNSFAFHPIKPFFVTGKNDVKLWKINENWSECQNENSSEEVSYEISSERSSESFSERSSESFSERSSENSYESFYDNSTEIPQVSYVTHLGTYEENRNIQSIIIHPKLPIFATIRIDSNITLRKINENTCEYIGSINSQRTYSNSVSFHPILPIIAVDSVDNTFKLYRFDSRVECIGTLEGHEGGILSITYHQSLPIMATGSKDCTIKIWLLNEDGNIVKCMSTIKIMKSIFTEPYYIKFHPILPILVGVIADRSVKIWK